MINDGKPMIDIDGTPVDYGDIIDVSCDWCKCHLAVRKGDDKYILWNGMFYTGRTSDGRRIGNVFDNPELMIYFGVDK